MNLLPVSPAHALDEQPQKKRWLVEDLWTDQAVGIIGGEPKCCKSFLALSLAVSVASQKPCLEHFAVPRHGRVLFFPAEDALPVVKRRLEGIAKAQQISLDTLPFYVITAPSLRLDIEADRNRLRDTVKKFRPRLLVLDPFVRLHAIDENAAGEVAKILAHLRLLQRSFHCAVALVHHSRKGAAKHRAGQALRGSSEFHAWGDSNLYLRRDNNAQLSLTIEHRAEYAPDSIPLVLNIDSKQAIHLAIKHTTSSTKISPNNTPPEQLVTDLLAAASKPLKLVEIRDLVKLRNSTLSQTLAQLINNRIVSKTNSSYSLL